MLCGKGVGKERKTASDIPTAKHTPGLLKVLYSYRHSLAKQPPLGWRAAANQLNRRWPKIPSHYCAKDAGTNFYSYEESCGNSENLSMTSCRAQGRLEDPNGGPYWPYDLRIPLSTIDPVGNCRDTSSREVLDSLWAQWGYAGVQPQETF